MSINKAKKSPKKLKAYRIKYRDFTKEIVESLPDGMAENGLGNLYLKLGQLPFKYVRPVDVREYECLVNATDFGYELLRLEFNNKYYEVKNESNL